MACLPELPKAAPGIGSRPGTDPEGSSEAGLLTLMKAFPALSTRSISPVAGRRPKTPGTALPQSSSLTSGLWSSYNRAGPPPQQLPPAASSQPPRQHRAPMKARPKSAPRPTRPAISTTSRPAWNISTEAAAASSATTDAPGEVPTARRSVSRRLSGRSESTAGEEESTWGRQRPVQERSKAPSASASASAPSSRRDPAAGTTVSALSAVEPATWASLSTVPLRGPRASTASSSSHAVGAAAAGKHKVRAASARVAGIDQQLQRKRWSLPGAAAVAPRWQSPPAARGISGRAGASGHPEVHRTAGRRQASTSPSPPSPRQRRMAPRAAVYAAADTAASRPRRPFMRADRSRLALEQPLPLRWALPCAVLRFMEWTKT